MDMCGNGVYKGKGKRAKAAPSPRSARWSPSTARSPATRRARSRARRRRSARSRRTPRVTTTAARCYQYPVTQAEREQLIAEQAAARARRGEVPDGRGGRGGGLPQVDLYVPCIGAHYTNTGAGREVRLVGAVGAAVRRHEPRLQDRRPELPRVPPGRPARGLRRTERHVAPAQLQRRSLPERRRASSSATSPRRRASARRAVARKVALDDIWMVHDWVVPGWECGWGVFAGECPELGGRIGGTVFDKPDPKSFAKAATGGGKKKKAQRPS